MRLQTLPKSMVVVGAGYIAVEMSHVFGAFGTRVTIIARGDTLLAKHDLDIRRRFTERYLQRFDLKLSARVDKVAMGDTDVRVSFTSSGRSQSVEAEILLIAVGRKPNGDRHRSGSGGLISIVADCGQVQVVGHGSDQVRHFIGRIGEFDVVEYGNSLGDDAVCAVLFVKNAPSQM